jgi:hypothetical protein
MYPELYTDGVGEIMVSGSIVRVDLVSLSMTERDANNTPKSVPRQRLIFSVEGFANSVDVMQKALQSLIDSGVVRKAGTPGGTAAPQPDQLPHARAGVSPNFR